MTIEKAFKRQIKDGIPVTTIQLSERLKTRYHSGTNVEVGNIVLHAFVKYSNTTDELTIIGAHHLNMYELDEEYSISKNSYTIPHIKLKDQRSVKTNKYDI
jgi:hypothetical protein